MQEDFGADVTELTRTSEQVKAKRNPIAFKNTFTKTPLRNGTPHLKSVISKSNTLPDSPFKT